VVAVFGYRAGMSAHDLTLLRFAASGLVMLPWFLRHGPRDACGIGWPRALLLALLAGPAYNMVLVGGLQWAPATHSSLIYPACTPVFTALVAQGLLAKPGRIPFVALGLLLAGVLAIKLGAVLGSAPNGNPDVWRGDLLFVGAAVMWSLYTVLMRRWNTDPLAVVCVVQVLGLLYVPLYFASHDGALFRLDPGQLALQTLYLGLLVSVVSVLMFNLAVKRIGPNAAMFTALMPVVGVSSAALWLDEPVTPSLGIGTLLIVAGLVWAVRGKRL
jgi:drug/metabolite transporter (DMT)-like permease